MTLPEDVRAYPDAIAQALNQLRLAGVNGPYSGYWVLKPIPHCRRAATKDTRSSRTSSV